MIYDRPRPGRPPSCVCGNCKKCIHRNVQSKYERKKQREKRVTSSDMDRLAEEVWERKRDPLYYVDLQFPRYVTPCWAALNAEYVKPLAG